jgi:hypothetical protein
MTLISVYVAHPLGAGPDRENNRRRAAVWVAWLAERYFVAPVCSWITLAEVWPETQRDLGLEVDRALVEFCGRVVLVGDRVSPGMQCEARWAMEVIDLTFVRCSTPDALTEGAIWAIDSALGAAWIARRHG